MLFIPAGWVAFLYTPVVLLALIAFFISSKFIPTDSTALPHGFHIYMTQRPLRHLTSAITALLALTVGFILSSVTFGYSDVDEAITYAGQAFLNNTNPYTNYVVPHILIGSTGSQTIYGPYNYGPVDLVVYSLGQLLTRWLFGPVWWFFAFNVGLALLAYLPLHFVAPALPDGVKFPPYAFIIGFALQDNVVLMVLFLCLALCAEKRLRSSAKTPVVAVLLTLGALTKLFLLFVLLGYLCFKVSEDLRGTISACMASLVVATTLVLVFGGWSVVDAVVLFHLDLGLRSQLAVVQGTLPSLVTMLGLSYLFPFLALVGYVLALLLCKVLCESLAERLLLLSLLCLFLIPSSAYAFLTIPATQLLTWWWGRLEGTPS